MQSSARCRLKDLEKLDAVTVQRCVMPAGSETVRSELHMFCDASEDGLGAVAYLRTTSSNGLHFCHILMGKCRVAPQKHLSIIRLELQGAVLGACLVAAVLKDLTHRPDDVICWTDSRVI